MAQTLEAISKAPLRRDAERRWLIGESDRGVLVVVYTIRDPGGVQRLISARRASRKERDRHEQSKGIPV